eukprot:2530348-Alexandrium_andersonii.AAC.1
MGHLHADRQHRRQRRPRACRGERGQAFTHHLRTQVRPEARQKALARACLHAPACPFTSTRALTSCMRRCHGAHCA